MSSIFGLNYRQTMDIDLSLKNAKLTAENILKIINEIIAIDIGDNVNIFIDGISSIREEDEYGGYRIKITVKIENVRESFSVDIATGDPITPREIEFKYKTIFDYKCIDLKSCNLETILSEKLETVLSRKELNGRLKDFYDIYLIYTLAREKLDNDILRKAVYNTFKKREFNDDINETFEIIENSYVLRLRWKSYVRHNKYAKDILYEDIMICLKEFIGILETISI